MYKNTMGQIKILRMIIGDVFLWNVSNKFVISCAHIHWRRVYQRAHGWTIIGKLHLQRNMVERIDSLRFKLTNCNCFRGKAYSNVVLHCCRMLTMSASSVTQDSWLRASTEKSNNYVIFDA